MQYPRDYFDEGASEDWKGFMGQRAYEKWDAQAGWQTHFRSTGEVRSPGMVDPSRGQALRAGRRVVGKIRALGRNTYQRMYPTIEKLGIGFGELGAPKGWEGAYSYTHIAGGAGKTFMGGAAGVFGLSKAALPGISVGGQAVRAAGEGWRFMAPGHRLGGALNLLFTAPMVAKGFKEGGVGGAVRAGAEQALSFGAWDVGLKAAKFAFKGTTVGKLASVLKHPAFILPALAITATIATVGALADVGRTNRGAELTGDMSAFSTRAAVTMRQRSLLEIQRSHMNARTALGNEASYMHL